MRRRKKREKWTRFQGVTAFTGMPGGGKSYSLAERAVFAMRRGMPVYSNEGFDIKGTRVLSSFEEFAEVKGPALICWDELPLYFNSRKWNEFPDGMLYKFTQIRKDGVRLAYSTIHEEMVDVNVRRVTFWYWHCRAMFKLPFGPVVIRRTLWPPKEYRRQNQGPYATEWRTIRRSIREVYDTYGKVAVPVESARKIDGLEADGFVKPRLARSGARSPLGGSIGSGVPVPEARPPVVESSATGPVVQAVSVDLDADPWGLAPTGGLFVGDDDAPVTMDRGAWTRP